MAGTNNQATHSNITLCSYNVKKYDDIKYAAIKSIFKDNTLLLIQETWLVEEEFIRQFKNDFPNSECISANKMELGDIRVGRKYGGVGICHHSNIKCKIENLTTTSKSICAQIICIENIRILLVNVYMPSSDNREALDEYIDILQEISDLCIKTATQHIILGGDWNADLNRNDGRTKLFKDFMSQENLFNPLELEIANVQYTFSRPREGGGHPITSTIDHFLISQNLIKAVNCYEARTLYNNCSDHVPLIMSLDIDIEYHKTYEREYKPSVAWHRCNDNNLEYYQCKLNQNLSYGPFKELVRCKDLKCTGHTELIKELYNHIINAVYDASKTSLPHTSQSHKKKVIPGWNEYVKEHSDRAKLWHEIWVFNGRAPDHFSAYIRRKTRLQYHYAIRRAVKENINVRNNKMGEAVSENEERTLWEEVRKISRTSNELPQMMDEYSTVEDISGLFANKYDTLYNSVNYNKHAMNRLSTDINSRIDTGCTNNDNIPNHPHSITISEVNDAIIMLKHGKKEENGLFSNHFKHGTNKLVTIITMLFNCMLTHGIAPDELLLGTMIPLIKNSKGINSALKITENSP